MISLLRLISGRTASAPVARERLQILLAHERGLRGQPELLELLRAEILAAVSRHVVLDPEKVVVRMGEGQASIDAGSRYRSAQQLRKVARGRELTRLSPDGNRAVTNAPGRAIQASSSSSDELI